MCPASRLINLDFGIQYRYRPCRHVHIKWTAFHRPLSTRTRIFLYSLIITGLAVSSTACNQLQTQRLNASSLSMSASVSLFCLLQPLYFTGNVEIPPSIVRQPFDSLLRHSNAINLCPPDRYQSTQPVSRACLSLNDSQPHQHSQRSGSSLRRKLIIDSGASFHVHPNLSDLVNIRACSNRIMGVDHQPHQCVSMGDMPVRARCDDGYEYDLLIKNVRYAPTFRDSLISKHM